MATELKPQTLDLNPCEVKDNTGNVKQALMAACPDCGAALFRLLVINGHNHIECAGCNTSFCQGGCGCDCRPATTEDTYLPVGCITNDGRLVKRQK